MEVAQVATSCDVKWSSELRALRAILRSSDDIKLAYHALTANQTTRKRKKIPPQRCRICSGMFSGLIKLMTIFEQGNL